MSSKFKEVMAQHRQYLLTGVSFAIPFIACGGILIALSLGLAPKGADNAPDPSHIPMLKLMLDIGVAAFTLMPVVLGGYISNAIAGKPGLVAGMVGGWLATHLGSTVNQYTGATVEASAGFLGALLAGILAGHLVNLIKKTPVPKTIKPIMPILIIPIVSSLIIGFLMLKVIGIPIADLMTWLSEWLKQLGTGNAVVLGLALGAMIAFDMGGPVNKVAFFFGAAMIKEGNFSIMGACAAAICVPPLGLGVATLIRRKLWSEEEREAGGAALAMGMIGITEGAIPFAAADPLRVIPCIMLGSMTASTIAMLSGVGDHAPHGGPIVLFAVDNRLMYVIAILAGIAVTAASITIVKQLTNRPAAPEQA
jgi:fructose-specific phosphotransferase system IIC component